MRLAVIFALLLGVLTSCSIQSMKQKKKESNFEQMDFYARAENPKGELGFFFRTTGTYDVPYRVKVRSCCFVNLSVLPAITKNVLLADLIAILGSLDIMMGEIDR